jgi:hypothetical protein
MGAVIFAIALTMVAGGATHCAALTRRDRNYWPMLRVLWAVFAFIYGGSGLAVLMNRRDPGLRDLIFAAAALGAVGYSVWFMKKRNRLPRFFQLDVAGTPTVVGLDEIERAANLVESAAHHGVLPESNVARLERALAAWHAHQRERLGARMKREAQERGK